jgi:SP family sugar:H+ symporter-like MFS transporter
VAAEIYPGRYRSEAIALRSAANWLFNFLLAFFTTFITTDIGFAYGYVFAGCNLAAVFIVYFFLLETNNKTLEEIDTMFLLEVSPLKSSKWEPPRGEDLITADKLMLNKGASRIDKRTEAHRPGTEHSERLSGNLNAEAMPGTSEALDPRQLMGSGTRGDSFIGRGSGPVRHSAW